MKKLRTRFARRRIERRLRTFSDSVEGIGDLLVYEAAHRNHNSNVKRGLDRLYDLTLQLVEDRQRWELPPKENMTSSYEDAIYAHITPNLEAFGTSVSQITRVHESSVDARNEDISRAAVYKIAHLISACSNNEKMESYVEFLLSNIVSAARLAIKNDDLSMHAAAVHWYIHAYQQHDDDQALARLEYLDQFDKAFFSIARHLVTIGHDRLFSSLVSMFHEGSLLHLHPRKSLFDLVLLVQMNFPDVYTELEESKNFRRQVRQIENQAKRLHRRQDLDYLLDAVIEMSESVVAHTREGHRDEIDGIVSEFRSFCLARMLLSNLIEMAFKIGAFSLFKEQFSLITYLWEYKQPSDADAHYLGEEIVPTSAESVAAQYFGSGEHERDTVFWEDHHGARLYFDRYFILLLARALGVGGGDVEKKAMSVNLADFDVNRISDIAHRIKGLIDVAQELKKEQQVWESLGFDYSTTDDIVDKGIIVFLDQLRKAAKGRISDLHISSPISERKRNRFFERFVKSFHESATLRRLLTRSGLFEDKTTEPPSKNGELWGYNQLEDRAAFFEEWNVSFSDWGSGYGRNLGGDENDHVFEMIESLVETVSVDAFQSRANELSVNDDLIIIAGSRFELDYLYTLEEFEENRFTLSGEDYDRSIMGWLNLAERRVPVHELNAIKNSSSCLLLRTTKLGNLVQHNPMEGAAEESSLQDIFSITFTDISTSPERLQELLDRKPEWLTGKGDIDEQIRYLKSRVHMQIFERPSFEPSPEIVGLCFKLDAAVQD